VWVSAETELSVGVLELREVARVEKIVPHLPLPHAGALPSILYVKGKEPVY